MALMNPVSSSTKQPEQMHAIVNREYGGLEVLHLEKVQKPSPSPGEVLVRIVSTTVNRSDCGARAADPFITRLVFGFFKPKQHILGSEFAGVIEAIGEGVTSFKVGEKVFGINEFNFSCHAEYVCINEKAAICKAPTSIPLTDCVALCEGPWFAKTYLDAANLKAGQHIFINGATGSIGSSAVQLAKALGAHITASCPGNKQDLVQRLGASKTIDYQTEDFRKLPNTFEVIFDAVGKTTFGDCKHLLKENGIFMSTELGPKAQNPFLDLWGKITKAKQRVLFPIPKSSKDDMLYFRTLIEAQKLKPVIDRRYKLEDFKEAYTYVESAQKIGSVLINIEGV